MLGYAAAALGRWTVTAVFLTGVALAAGMNVSGSGVDVFGLYTLAAILNLTAVFWSAGVAMRLRTMQAGPVMQLPVFLVLFFAPVYVPLSLLQGWIHGVAVLNPVTRVLEAGRGFVAGSANRGRRCIRRRTRARGRVLALGAPRAAQGRSCRVKKVGLSPPLGGWWRRAHPYCSPRATRPGTGHAARIAQYRDASAPVIRFQ